MHNPVKTSALMRSRSLLTAGFSVLSMLLCGPGCAGAGANMPVPLPCTGPGPMQLTIDQECVVRLPANPSTGYQWVLQPVDPPVVQLVGAAEYVAVAVPSVPPRVGQGGEVVFRLRAVATGDVTLRWDYRRSWEPLETPPVEVHTLTLQVR